MISTCGRGRTPIRHAGARNRTRRWRRRRSTIDDRTAPARRCARVRSSDDALLEDAEVRRRRPTRAAPRPSRPASARARPQLAVEAVARGLEFAQALGGDDRRRRCRGRGRPRSLLASVRVKSMVCVLAYRVAWGWPRASMAMMSRWTSLVPPPKVRISAERWQRSSRPRRTAPGESCRRWPPGRAPPSAAGRPRWRTRCRTPWWPTRRPGPGAAGRRPTRSSS